MNRTRILTLAAALVALPHASVVSVPAGKDIIQGKPVKAEVFTWQIGILSGPPTQNRAQATIRCGGALITPHHVLTAAHCIDKNSEDEPQRLPYDPVAPDNLTVVLNATNIRTDGSVHAVNKITVHPSWKQTNTRRDFDAAILTLDGPVKTLPIRISRHTINASAGEAWVSGWGETEHGVPSVRLLGARVPIVNFAQCIQGNDYNGRISNQMLCAGDQKGEEDSCSGDSGGPLVLGALDKVQLIGLVSWGYGCGAENNYGVYTRVSQILDWIASTTNGGAIFTSEQPGPLFTNPENGEI